ncbi:hypothetical protein AB0I30_15665 [Nocardia tengchongensis]|uniref:hypothetical protein n=1 Tax=Nocardia tengchongensis TaxID=2055889 RepID=UPI0033C7D2BC
MTFEYRVDDILELSCPFTAARVTELTADEVFVEWPWWAVDPDSDGERWNGVVAVAAGPGAPGWEREVFRIRPGDGELAADAPCRIGIPPTVVRVIGLRRHEPPRETGWLPRPRREIVYVRAGHPAEPDVTDQGSAFDPDDDIPRKVELRFRPYAFLEIGDEIADAAGRAWRFGGPWNWEPFGTAETTEPAWPLMLLTRDGDSEDAAAVDVTEATLSGSHQEELARWRELAGLTPIDDTTD